MKAGRKSFSESVRKSVLELLDETGGMSVKDLAETLGASVQTVLHCLNTEDMVYEERKNGTTWFYPCKEL